IVVRSAHYTRCPPPAMTRRAPSVLLPLLVAAAGAASEPALLRVSIPGQTTHNGNYRHAALLYALQTLLAPPPGAPNVLASGLVVQDGRDAWLDLGRTDANGAALLRAIAARSGPAGTIALDQVEGELSARYAGLSAPYPTLDALRGAHPYRDNPEWLVVPV